MYYAKMVKTGKTGAHYNSPTYVMTDMEGKRGEWVMMEDHGFGCWPARFPCTHHWWTGQGWGHCEIATNKPMSDCGGHA